MERKVMTSDHLLGVGGVLVMRCDEFRWTSCESRTAFPLSARALCNLHTKKNTLNIIYFYTIIIIPFIYNF